MKLEEKFVAYVDILGFKSLVEASEAGKGMSLEEILEIVSKLGQPTDRQRYDKHGPMVCSMSRCVSRDLAFRIIQISDCAILSTEISPAGIVNLVERAWAAAINLLAKGILCRGYITRGPLYHTDNQIIGSGYHRAHAKESAVAVFSRDANDRGTPFIEIDPAVTQYVRTETDDCVRKMFARFVKCDGDVCAIFPFKLLSHSFAITPGFDPSRELRSNEVLRSSLREMRAKVLKFVADGSDKAKKKAEHYVRAIDAQLAECDRTDDVIARLGRPFPGL